MFPICEKVVYTWRVGFDCGVFFNAFSLKAGQQKFCERFAYAGDAHLVAAEIADFYAQIAFGYEERRNENGFRARFKFKTRALPDFDSEKVLA